MKQSTKKIGLITILYIAMSFLVLIGEYYLQYWVHPIFFYSTLLVLSLAAVYMVSKALPNKKTFITIYGISLLATLLLMRFIAMLTFDAHIYFNREVRNVYIQKVAIEYIEAIESNDKSALKDFSPAAIDYCKGEALRMANSTYKEYLGTNISNIDINIYESTSENTNLFHVIFEYLEGDETKSGEITGVTITEKGRLYICGEYY